MKVSINTKLINRNKKISQYTLYIALALLTLGFIWTLRNNDPQKTLTGYLILIPSYILVQISIYMANNWGSDPRPDEIVLNALKGLNNDFHIYIYTTKIPYILVGPMGIWALTPHHHKGEIVYNSEKENYLQKNGPNFLSKYFAQEGLPNLIKVSESSLKKIDAQVLEILDKANINPKAVHIFYSDEATIKSSHPEYIAIKAEKLKGLVRRESKNNALPAPVLDSITENLPPAD